MASDQTLLDAWLDHAVGDFDNNPLSTQLMRRLAYEHSEAFSKSAMRYLGAPGHSPALRFMTSVLMRQREVFDRLTDPGPVARERSQVLFQRLTVIDPSFDVMLARMLPDRTGVNHSTALEGQRATRAIEILDVGSPGRRLLSVLSHLTESRDPRLCSKASLFIGRRMQRPAWAEKQLEHNDRRVRANVIESFWGFDSPQAREILQHAVGDPDNRVSGNALIGLHLLREPETAEGIEAMAALSDPRFRATAAWAMGYLRDAAFQPRLASLVRDEEESVRRAALRALVAGNKPKAPGPEPVPPAGVPPAPTPEPVQP